MQTKYAVTINTNAGNITLGIFDTPKKAANYLAGTRGEITPIFLTDISPADLEQMTLPELIAIFNA